jgi:VWFA-related protein
VQSNVPLVVLDVAVADSKGHPVRGLKASSFSVREKGREMTVSSFEEHRSDQAARESALPPQHLGPNIFSNIASTSSTGPLNILLMDALNTPLADQMYVRRQMLQFLKTLPEGTTMAIFGLSSHLYLLQGFTNDPALLRAAIDGTKANGLPSTSPLLGAPVDSPGLQHMTANMQQFLAEMNTSQTTMRMQYTLTALYNLARYLAGFAGRKNLIWFCGSFPLNVLPDADLANPFGAMADYERDVKATAHELVRSQVAVYPVDARGLFVSGAYTGTADGSNVNSVVFERRLTTFASDQDTMITMAKQTGGKAFYNTNDLKGAVQEAVDHGSNYYTMTYTPTDRKWDGNYRNVRVTVDQPRVSLYYRHGYYAFDPSVPARGEMLLPMEVAMVRGGPAPTQILLKAKVVRSAETETTLPKANRPNEKTMRPPYRRYTVWCVPYLGNISFTARPDGSYHGEIEFQAVLYTPNGELMNAVGSTAKLNLSATKYHEVMKTGLQMYQYIDAPVQGEYFLRLGVHDITSDRVGAIELPLNAVQP